LILRNSFSDKFLKRITCFPSKKFEPKARNLPTSEEDVSYVEIKCRSEEVEILLKKIKFMLKIYITVQSHELAFEVSIVTSMVLESISV